MFKKISLFIVFSLFLTVGAWYGVTRMNVQKQYIAHTQSIEKSENDMKTFHDDMWKTIKTQLKVEDSYQEDYEKAVTAYVERGESYSDAMWTWVQESEIPVPSENIRIQLMNTIQDKNTEFSMYRKEVNRVVAERNLFAQDPWNYIFLGPKQREPVESKIITSNITNESFESGEDNLEWLD